MTRTPRLLIIDDNRQFADDLCLLLQNEFQCRPVLTAERAFEELENKLVDLILLDIDLGSGMDGFGFLEKLKENYTSIPVIMITRDESIETVVKAIKMGAFDYVGKKPDLSELKIIIQRALAEYGLRKENELLREEVRHLTGEFVGESKASRQIKEMISKMSQIDSTVLITGESGTGKEIVARQIHANSGRSNQPFVTVNCAAIPKDLFESELFGHEKGAFTGAIKRKLGKFELADNGTLFLDEVAELDVAAQAKLLRAIEEKTFERVGGEDKIEVDVRILSATNRNLKEGVAEGTFRKDLYYRLNVLQILIPPLRERQEDIALLTSEILMKKCRELKKKVSRINDQAMNLLLAYEWPGNVREMQNIIEGAIIHSDSDVLTERDFPTIQASSVGLANYETAKQKALENFQREYISSILRLTQNNITQAAKRMGISRQGLQKMMRQLDLHP